MKSFRRLALLSATWVLSSVTSNAGTISERERAFVATFGACMAVAEMLRLTDGADNPIVVRFDRAKFDLLDRLTPQDAEDMLKQLAQLRRKFHELEEVMEVDAKKSGKSVAYLKGVMAGSAVEQGKPHGCASLTVPAWFDGTR